MLIMLAGLSIIGAIITIVTLKETKDKSLEEISKEEIIVEEQEVL